MIPYCVNYFNYYFTRSLSTISKGFKIFTAGVQDLGLVTAVGSQASQVFSSLATTLHTSTTALGGFLAAAAGIAALIGIADLVTESFAEAEKKADQARESYESTKSELDGVNSELETTQSRINEIKAQGSLSPVDEAELAKLQTMNEQLLAHKAILEKVAGIEQKEVADAAAHVLTKKRTYDSGELTYAPTTVGGFVNIPSQPLYVKGDIIEETASKQKQLNSKTEEYNKLLKEQARLNPEDPEFKSIDNRLGVLEDQKKRLEVDIADNLKTIETNYADLFDEDGAILPGNEELVKRIDDLNYSLLGGVEKAQKTQEKINNIVSSSDGIKEQYDSLVDLAKARENVGIVAEDISDELSQSLKDAGVDVNDFIKQVNSEALSGNIEEMTRQLREAYTDGAATVMTKESMEAAKAYDDFISNLKPEEIEVFWNYVRDNDIDLTNIATEDLQNAFDTAMEQLEVDNVEPKIPLEDIISSEGFKNSVDDFQSNISTIQSALDSLKAGEDIDLVDLIQQFPQLAGETGNLQEALEGLKSESLSDILSTVIGQTSDLIDSGDIDRIGDFITQLLTSVDLSDVNLGDLKNEVISAMLPHADDAVGRQMVQDSVNSWFSNIDVKDLTYEFDKSSVNSLISELSSVQKVLSSQLTGQSISLDDYNSDALADYRSALEYVNGSLQLNIDKVNDLVKAKQDEQLATIAQNKELAQTKYMDNARQVEELRAKLRDCNFAQGETADSVRSSIDALLSENASIMDVCGGYDLMTSSILQATDAYHNWINAQNASQSGDMFDSALTAFEKINDTLNKTDSDSYGRVGNADYKAALDFVLPESVDREDEDAINSYMSSIHDFFTWDENGARDGLNIDNFCQKAIDAGLMVFDESSEEYRIAGEKTMADFAEGLNLSLPLVQAMFGEMQEFGGEFDWADEAFSSFGDGIVAAQAQISELESQIDNLEWQKSIGLQVDDSEIDEAKSKLEELEQKKKELTEKATINIQENIDIDKQLSDAQAELEGWKAKLESEDLDSDAKIKVEAEISSAERKIEELQEKKDELQKPTQVEIDASIESIDEQIATLEENLSNFSNQEYYAKFGLTDDEAQAKVSEIQGQIDSLNQQKAEIQTYADTKQANKDLDNIEKKKINDKKFSVSVIDHASSKISSIQSQVSSLHDKNITITTTKKTVNETVEKGRQDVNGTAHASGTARAGGNWGTALGGKTLMGELGRKILRQHMVTYV